MAILGSAKAIGGMDQGRQAEHFGAYESLAATAFGALGHNDTGAVLNAQMMPAGIFGSGDARGQGQAGAGFAGRLHGVLSSAKGPFQSYMMRAMGYGTKDGPGYIEMRKRSEAGVFDSRNLLDVFDLMDRQGLGEKGMFRGLEGVAGGQLKAHEIEALVGALGTAEGREFFRNSTGMDKDTLASLATAHMSPAELKILEESGLLGLGKTAVSAGESHELLMEGRTKEYGPKSLQVQDSLLKTGDALVGLLGKFIDGGMILGLATSVEKLALAIERGTGGSGNLPPALANKSTWGQLSEIFRQMEGPGTPTHTADGQKRLPGSLPSSMGGLR
tara:strand:+ start:43 stop:1035 length:993 start_codon:yes stop_codon:yes gene_type:complete